jgi:hypothetical protein
MFHSHCFTHKTINLIATIIFCGFGVVALILLMGTQVALAGDNCQNCQKQTCVQCFSGQYTYLCPDIYCSKPLPCVPCPQACCLPNDYCCKLVPCVSYSLTGCLPNNYCQKPMPCICPSPVKYNCGTSQCDNRVNQKTNKLKVASKPSVTN